MANLPRFFKGLPVPGPHDKITVYTIGVLSDDEVHARVETILEQHPALRRVYDQPFLDGLIPDRFKMNNHLLCSLADTANPTAGQFWAEVELDLLILEDSGAFDKFNHKLRQRESGGLNATKTELELAAWMKRKGCGITLEPIDTKTGKKCEFSAASQPRTFWEVKSVFDQPDIRAQMIAQEEVKRGLRYFEAPYVLHIDFERSLAFADVHASTKSVLREIQVLHRAGRCSLGTVIVRSGFRVTVVENSTTGYGHQRTSSASHALSPEDMLRVLGLANEATPQIPEGAAGIIVLDATMADFVKEAAVEVACYGERCWAFRPDGKLVPARRRPALFKPELNTRISAVMHYRRRIASGQLEVTKGIYHNPFANHPLPPDLLADANVTEFRPRADSYLLVP